MSLTAVLRSDFWIFFKHSLSWAIIHQIFFRYLRDEDTQDATLRWTLSQTGKMFSASL